MNKIILLLAACILLDTANAQTPLTSGIPAITGQGVYAIWPVGDTVYVQGQFGTLGDSLRNSVGSFNIRTGKVTAFNPAANYGATSITIAGNRMLMMGYFDSVAGQFRNGVAMVDITTGALQNWTDTGSFSFSSNEAGFDSTYFYFFNGESSWIKRVNYHTNITSDWHTPVIPFYDMNAICVTDSFLYVGGEECGYTGADTVFNYLCRFRTSDGSLDVSWHPQPDCIPGADGINSIAVNKYNQLFVVGEFDKIGGKARQGIAGFDAVTGVMSGFNPNISSNESFSVAVTDNDVWLGCNSYLIGGQYRWRLAELDINSGNATCWDASAVTQNWNFCDWVSVVGDTVYACNYGGINVFTGSPRPHPASNVIQGPRSANPGQTATYYVPDSVGYTYSWLISGGTGYSTTNSISVTWGNGPAGNIKLVENNNIYSTCSSDTVQFNVSITTCPAGPDSITGPADAGPGETVNYSVPSTAGATYHWIIAGGTGTSSTDSISITWGNGASGAIQMIENNNNYPNCSDTVQLMVHIACPAGPDSITGPANASAGEAINYSVPFVTGAAYNWTITGGTGTSSGNSISVTWGNNSSGTVQVIETNNLLPLCLADTISLQVAILPAGVHDLDYPGAQAWPNPTTGKVRLQLTGGTCVRYSIYDITGQLLLQEPVNSQAFDVDLGQFNQGIYIIALQGEHKDAYIKLTKL